MSGTWETQNKILPGAYINIRTKEPLSITLGDRGTVLFLQEMESGTAKTIYNVTADSMDLPDSVKDSETKLCIEALKNSVKAMIYCLPGQHTPEDVKEALETLKTVQWDVLCYPYDGESHTDMKKAIEQFVKAMREDEGIKCQAVLANHAGDYEGILNVVQGIVMNDMTEFTCAETTAWVAGACAGAGIITSNTGKKYVGAIDVKPRMTKSQMETAVQEGKFIFKADNAQNVSVVYDINSFVTTSPEKSKMLSKNRIIRTIDNVANDINRIFESNYIGKVSNNIEGRSLFKAALVEYMNTLQDMGAIQNFESDDVSIVEGINKDSVTVNMDIKPVDSVEKIYMTVKLS